MRIFSKYRVKGISIFSDKGILEITNNLGEKTIITARREKKYQIQISNLQSQISKLQITHLDNAPIKILVNGERKIQREGKEKRERAFRGKIIIYKGDREIIIVNRIPIVEYIKSVIVSEIGKDVPFEALKAQAVVSRTWVYNNLGKRHRLKGENGSKQGYDFCDLTHCQSYGGSDWESAESKRAVVETDDEVLIFEGKPIEVFYHSTCGGKTASGAFISKKFLEPYLMGIDDSLYCKMSPHLNWKFVTTKERLGRALGRKIRDIRLEYEGMRVKKVILLGGKNETFGGEEFRIRVNRVLGWMCIRSNWFVLKKRGNKFVFEGKGLGHGVGMCQWGVIGRANAKQNYKQILETYFPGAKIERI